MKLEIAMGLSRACQWDEPAHARLTRGLDRRKPYICDSLDAGVYDKTRFTLFMEAWERDSQVLRDIASDLKPYLKQ